VPSAVKVFNWIATLHKSSIDFAAPLLYAFSFIGLFTIGGLTGVFVASLGFDVHVHDTYFIVSHFHFIMVGGTMSAFLGAIHYWWPKLTGRLYPRRWAQVAAIFLFVGFNATFLPQFILGYTGMPRRSHEYLAQYQPWHVMSTLGSLLLGLGYLLPFFYLSWSWRKGPRAPDNPWGAEGLEWRTSSPPPKENFKKLLVVEGEAYRYQVREAE
jgi:cytochrome c oxidase subunit 1